MPVACRNLLGLTQRSLPTDRTEVRVPRERGRRRAGRREGHVHDRCRHVPALRRIAEYQRLSWTFVFVSETAFDTDSDELPKNRGKVSGARVVGRVGRAARSGLFSPAFVCEIFRGLNRP